MLFKASYGKVPESINIYQKNLFCSSAKHSANWAKYIFYLFQISYYIFWFDTLYFMALNIYSSTNIEEHLLYLSSDSKCT